MPTNFNKLVNTNEQAEIQTPSRGGENRVCKKVDQAEVNTRLNLVPETPSEVTDYFIRYATEGTYNITQELQDMIDRSGLSAKKFFEKFVDTSEKKAKRLTDGTIEAQWEEIGGQNSLLESPQQIEDRKNEELGFKQGTTQDQRALVIALENDTLSNLKPAQLQKLEQMSGALVQEWNQIKGTKPKLIIDYIKNQYRIKN